jgi:hypothetical protein
MSTERKNVSLSLPAMEGELLPEENCYQAQLRAAVYDGVKEADVKAIVEGIVKRAKEGDVQATKIFFDQILGAKVKPTQIVVNNHFDNAEQAEKLTRGGNRSRNAG